MIKIKIKDAELPLEEAKEVHAELGKLFGQQNSPIIPGLPVYPWPTYPIWPDPGVGYPPIVTYTTSGTCEIGDIQ